MNKATGNLEIYFCAYTVYFYGVAPGLVPLSGETFWNVSLVKRAGFDPEDSDVVCTTLAEDFQGHKRGCSVVTGQTTEGAPFTIFDDV